MISKFTAAISALTTAIFLTGCSSLTPKQAPDPGTQTLIEDQKQNSHSEFYVETEPHSEVGEIQVVNPFPQQFFEVDDLWNHIRKSENLATSTDDASRKRVQKQLRKLRKNQHFFDVMGTRATPYIHHIINELNKRDMPLYLALLPIIESGYQVKVTSSQKAAGLWQIMPSTGKYLGLKQNWWYDGRRDLIASTNAALNYLQQLHERFEDWQLTLAAYNSGGATVANAIKKNKRHGKPTDYWSLALPPETEKYIPKLIALETVINSPASYDVELLTIPNQPMLKVVDLKRQIQLKKVAELADVEYQKLRILNAGFKRWATAPEGPHQILVPKDSAEQLEYAIAALPEEDRVKWRNHKIKSGESLWTIARKYDISINLLMKTNHLETDKLRIGKNLLIPDGTVSESIISTAPVNTVKIPKLKNNKYRVKSGDSLWLIARRFDIHVKQILEWNDLKKDQAIKPGEDLKILLEKPILNAASL
ncbi:MAG: LysM peptidoglycan-binding domain-containing protein [Gammaproteobacteria bacterium]